MYMTLTKQKPKRKPKKRKTILDLSHTPNYLTILPPGELIEEKMFELGLDASQLAKRMGVSVETVEKLIRYEIPLTENLAKKLEKATWMPAHVMLRFEARWRENMQFAMEHPEIPAYLNGKIINQKKNLTET